MAEYLRDCHYRYSTDEEPTTFDGFALRETFQFSDRRFWVWSCTDGFGRTWDVIVGQGRTSVHGATGNALWMHGERNDGRPEPRDLIARDYPEHNDYSGRVN